MKCLSQFLGKINDVEVELFTIENEKDMKVHIMTYGAAITKIELPDAYGNIDDIVLGFKDLEGYQSPSNPYMGATIGRVCNRIANGTFMLGEDEIELTKNYGEHHLHGGEVGFDKVIWKVDNKTEDSVLLWHESPDNHEGYPGTLNVKVKYTLNNDNLLSIIMEAETDKPTVVNMTNHTYFNLAGESTGKEGLYDHIFKINADKFTPASMELIPTGVLVPVVNTPLDFCKPTRIDDRIHKRTPARLGFDDNFCLNANEEVPMTEVALVRHGPSGRWLQISSNQPGVQFYTCNHFAEPEEDILIEPIHGKSEYKRHAGFCLETQKFPNAPNHDNFPSIVLRPGEKYTHEVNYQFGVDRAFYLCNAATPGLLRRYNVCNIDCISECKPKSKKDEVVIETKLN